MPTPRFQGLIEFSQSNEFGLLNQGLVPLFRAYLQKIQQLVQQTMMQQQMMQAAAQFSTGLRGQGQGQGQGVQPQPLPGMQVEAPTAAEIGGAGQQGPPGSKV